MNAISLIPKKVILTAIPLLAGGTVVRDTLQAGTPGFFEDGGFQELERSFALKGPRSWTIRAVGLTAKGDTIYDQPLSVDRLGAGENRTQGFQLFPLFFAVSMSTYFPDSVLAAAVPLVRRMRITRFALDDKGVTLMDSVLDPARPYPRSLNVTYDYMKLNFLSPSTRLRIYGDVDGFPTGALLYEGLVAFGSVNAIYLFSLAWKGPVTGAETPASVTGDLEAKPEFFRIDTGVSFKSDPAVSLKVGK